MQFNGNLIFFLRIERLHIFSCKYGMKVTRKPQAYVECLCVCMCVSRFVYSGIRIQINTTIYTTWIFKFTWVNSYTQYKQPKMAWLENGTYNIYISWAFSVQNEVLSICDRATSQLPLSDWIWDDCVCSISCMCNTRSKQCIWALCKCYVFYFLWRYKIVWMVHTEFIFILLHFVYKIRPLFLASMQKEHSIINNNTYIHIRGEHI